MDGGTAGTLVASGTAIGRTSRPMDLLPTSHSSIVVGGHSVVALSKLGRNIVNEKLRVLVSVDLDGAKAQVKTQGHVTVQSIQGLYDVMKRADSLVPGLSLELDMTLAEVEPQAMEELRGCARSHHLPVQVDPLQRDYRFSILAPKVTAAKLAVLPVAESGLAAA